MSGFDYETIEKLSYKYAPRYADIPKEVFLTKRLKILKLGCKGLVNVTERISELTYLEELYIDGNKISELPDSLFTLQNLKILFIDNCEIEVLSENINGCINLTRIYARDNKLMSLPDNITKLVNLEYLAVGGNNISYLPENFGDLKNLQHLDIGVNKLTKLPDSFSILPKLEFLNLSSNGMIFNPIIFQSMATLKTVNLSGNKLIGAFPFKNMINLTELSLFVSDAVIPKDIIYCQKLTILKIISTVDLIVPQELFFCESLIELHLEAQNIMIFPKDTDTTKLINLKSLTIHNLVCDSLPRFINDNLQELTINHSIIKNGLNFQIGELKNLKILSMCRVNLTTFPVCLQNLKNLEKIFLIKCDIATFIEQDYDFPKLRGIMLSYNQLTSVPMCVKNFAALNVLILRGNNITETGCDLLGKVKIVL